jgi:hypothetical protein
LFCFVCLFMFCFVLFVVLSELIFAWHVIDYMCSPSERASENCPSLPAISSNAKRMEYFYRYFLVKRILTCLLQQQ